MSNIENSICEAIELIVNKSISEAGYDRTIQGVVKACADATIGKYKIAYQDSIFYAYATNADVTYNIGSMVYILIPGNDMSKDKTILGTVDKLGINYVSNPDGDEAYDIVGTNCITSSDTYLLSSYRNHNQPIESPVSYVEVIYAADANKNNIGINTVALNEYIKESSSLVCGAHFKTSLNVEQQYQGNYGIIFGLDFADNATGDTVTRYYTVDVDNMTGNPYRLTLGKRQYGIFSIDGANFKRIASISIFTKDFPHHKNDDEIVNKNLFDIRISTIEISGANIMSDEELNSCGISFYTPDGTFFPVNSPNTATLRVTAQVKMRGKLVDAAVQKIPFYWFREDLSIVPASERYNKYGGRGWRCLNQYNIITEVTEETSRQVEWIPAQQMYTVSIADATAQENKYKCVIVYDGNVYSKTIIIKNMYNAPKITIESNLGTQFYYDIGRPTLTCFVDKRDNVTYVKPQGYIYHWAVEDIYGNIINLPEDIVENQRQCQAYANAEKELQQLQNAITSGVRFANEATDELSQKQVVVDEFKYIQRVSLINNDTANRFDNKLYNVAVGEITKFATYKCSVFNSGGVYLGTASIKLNNTLETEDVYTLVINNGTQIYKYSEYGVSPASPAVDSPIMIPTLSFNIFDNLGNSLDETILRQCAIQWKVPITNTMLMDIQHNGTIGAPDAYQQYQYFNQATELGYKIQNKYYYDRKNNDIELTVNYKGMSLTARTDLSFIKEGENGTNGTDYTCKIVPNSNQNYLPMHPTLTVVKGATSGYLNFKYQNGDTNNIYLNSGWSTKAPFKVEVYKAGELVYSGAESGTAIDSVTGMQVPITISWEMFKNKYTSTVSDASDLTIDQNNGKIKYTGAGGNNPANIIKCTVYYGNGTSNMGNRYCIYATLPIIKAIVTNNKYYINLKDNTGFNSVIYTSDGTVPKYDSANPFEIIVTETINGVNEIVSMINGSHAINTYTWSQVGVEFDYSRKMLVDSKDLIHLNNSVYLNGLKANQRSYKPNTNYSGLSVTNAVVCTCDAGTIHIPIHFLLNKYGLAELNGWDGNSVQIDDEGGFILAPEIGAGKKETDNSFTGVLMGEVQEPNRTTSDIGLMGYKRGTRSFLLDAENGSAILGAGNGKIIIDPSTGKAMISSGNFWNSYTEKGLPTSYTYRDNQYRKSGNGKGEGLLIDLTTPELFFGNGTFYVTADGYLHARGGGDIGGWKINDYQLYSNDNKTGLNSVAEGTGNKTVAAPLPDGNVNKTVAFWAGGTTTPKFYVTHDGYLRCEDATIGSGTNKIYIGKSGSNSALYTSGKGTKDTSHTGFYLGVDGFALGTTHSITYNGNTKNVSAFQVDNDGTLYAKAGYIGSSTTGWNIKTNALTNGKTSYNETTNNGVYLGTSGIGLGKGTFYVSSSGALHAVSGDIGGWKLTTNSIRSTDSADFSSTSGMYFGSSGLRLGSTFSVTSSGALKASSVDITGKITATSGTIGGWTINQSSLTANSGKVSLTSGGSLSGPNWFITSAGKATFSDINVTGGHVAGGTVGSGIIGGNINAGSVGTTQIGNLAVTNGKIASLDAGKLLINGNAVSLNTGWYTYGLSTSGTSSSFNTSLTTSANALTSVTITLLRKQTTMLTTSKEESGYKPSYTIKA